MLFERQTPAAQAKGWRVAIGNRVFPSPAGEGGECDSMRRVGPLLASPLRSLCEHLPLQGEEMRGIALLTLPITNAHLPLKANRHIGVVGSSRKCEARINHTELGLIFIRGDCCFQCDRFCRDYFFIFGCGHNERR